MRLLLSLSIVFLSVGTFAYAGQGPSSSAQVPAHQDKETSALWNSVKDRPKAIACATEWKNIEDEEEREKSAARSRSPRDQYTALYTRQYIDEMKGSVSYRGCLQEFGDPLLRKLSRHIPPNKPLPFAR